MKRIGNENVEWKKVYLRVGSTSIDSYSRYFQYRILNNILFTNKLLYVFKLVPSPRCSFCQLYDQTIDHLFVFCLEARNFYFLIQNWGREKNLEFPQHNIENIILGAESVKPLINHIILIFKLVLYKARESGKTPSLEYFKNYLNYIQKIEFTIALKNGKLESHNKKWKPLLVRPDGSGHG